MLWNYAFLNRGLTLTLNGQRFKSENGLKDLLTKELTDEPLYPIIHLEGEDIESALTHGNHYGESTGSFREWPSHHDGRHASRRVSRGAGRDVAQSLQERLRRRRMCVSRSTRRSSYVCRSQSSSRRPRPKLGSASLGRRVPRLRIRRQVSPAVARYLPAQAPRTGRDPEEEDRGKRARAKGLAGIRNIAKERAKKASLHNRKLRDCRLHLGDKNPRAEESTLFIVEGDSAAGSLTCHARRADAGRLRAERANRSTPTVLTKKVIYENEEFHLLQSALNIEDGLDGLRYNKIVIATDADVDGMHIRLLLLSSS
jgi:topoisomerase-4 subunit B